MKKMKMDSDFCSAKIFIFVLILIKLSSFNVTNGQSYYFTEQQKNAILQQHKQRLADEAMKMFENQFKLPTSSETERSSTNGQMFNQMINYHGLYENLYIKNVTGSVIAKYCQHESLSQEKIVGFDYKRHRNQHHLVCFTKNAFVVRTFRLDNHQRILIFDDDYGSSKNVLKQLPGTTLIQLKLYRQYDTDQLFIAALVHNGVHQIRIYEVLMNGPQKIVDKELLHTFKIHEPVRQIDILHYDLNKIRLVALIDAGWRALPEEGFLVETVPTTNLVDSIIKINAHNPLRMQTLRIQSQGFLVVANATHWSVFRYQDRNVDQVNLFRMRYFIKDLQIFNNGHRYYVGVATHQEQYIYQWKDGKRGFYGVARIRLPLVYKMNCITISYSRVDNFFYFDQLESETISIYGYDITNSVFMLLRTLHKSQLNHQNVQWPLFDGFNSINLNDHNYVYELKLTINNEIYLMTYETIISNAMIQPQQDQNHARLSSLHNLQRYNKQIYERKIEHITKNVMKLDQQETISKYAANLTFNFNVTFRGRVRVNHYRTSDPRALEESHRIRINRRDYAFGELRLSFDKVNEEIERISKRMNGLNQILNDEVVYRDQNANINGRKDFINKVSVKKIYAEEAWLQKYRGQNVDNLLDNLYRVNNVQQPKITGRKTFLSNVEVHRNFSVSRLNGRDLGDYLYTDLDQDIKASYWYRQPFYSDRIDFPDGHVSSNISLKNAIFINQQENLTMEPIRIRNKLVFDKIKIDNLYANTIDEISVIDLPDRVLIRNSNKSQQVIRVPTQIDHLHVRSDLIVELLNDKNVTKEFNNIINKKKDYRLEMPIEFHSDVRMNLLNVNGTVNNIRIPDDLVDRNSKQEIYGVKRFRSIRTHNINVTYLNHLQIPADIVTLTGDNEIISSDLKLDRLLLKGNLQVNGLFDGVNLTHLDERFLKTFQNRFENLTFLQPVNVSKITVKGSVNGIYLDKLYSEACFKNQRTLFIQGKKTVKNVFRCKNIYADTVNGEVIDNYIKLNDPIVNFSNRVKFASAVKFSDVELQGTIDGVNVSDLIGQAVTLDSNQKLTGARNFTDGIKVMNRLEIHGGKINNIHDPNNWLRYSGQQNISSPIRFMNVQAKTLSIGNKDDFEATLVNGEDFTKQFSKLIFLDDFDNKTSSGTTWNAILHCVNCSTSNIETETVDSMNFTDFIENYLSKSKPQMINSEKIFLVDQYFDDISTTKQNAVAGLDMRILQHQAITNEGYNIITKPVIITGNLNLTHGKMQADLWNQINLKRFNEEIVRRTSNETIRIESDLIYQADVDLMADINVKRINRLIPEESIMTTYGNYNIYAPVVFNEKLIASNDVYLVNGKVNEANLKELEQDLLKMNERGELVLNENGVINFVDNFQVKEIIVNGKVDDRTVDRDSILMSNGDQNVKKLTLDGQQWFNGSIQVLGNINHHFDKDSLTKIVLKDSIEEQEIDYQKTFAKIIVKEIYHENGLINVNVVNSVNLTEFESNVIYPSNKRNITIVKIAPRFMENVTILNPNLKIVGEINGVRIGDVVRLDRVRQTITGHKVFDEIVFNEDVEVSGLLNQIDIAKVSKEMLLVYGNQHIKTPVVFIAPMYIKTNSSVGLFNNYLPEELVTLNDPNRTLENFQFQFDKIEVLPGLKMAGNGLLNGVNLTDVYLNGFMNDYSPEELKALNSEMFDESELPVQEIAGTLVINEAQFNDNITLSAHLNDLDLSETVKSIQQKFDPKIDSKEMSQKLYDYKTLISTNRHYYEYANFEIDSFNQATFDQQHKPLSLIYFEQKFKIFNISGNYIFNNLYEKYFQNHVLWQTLKLDDVWMFVAEIWPLSFENEIFRLSAADPISGKFWPILEQTLEYGSRPFLFSMDHTLHVIYFEKARSQHYGCLANYDSIPQSETNPRLFVLELDLGELNHKQRFVQTFSKLTTVGNVGHYFYSGADYLLFNSFGDLDESSEIIIYQRPFHPDCPKTFQLFQSIPISKPVRQISLFTFGVETLIEPYIALRTDSHLNVWKQEGINGFTKQWSIGLLIHNPNDRWQQQTYTGNNSKIPLFPFNPNYYSSKQQSISYENGPRLLIFAGSSFSHDCPNTWIPEQFYEANFNQYFLPRTVLHLMMHDYV